MCEYIGFILCVIMRLNWKVKIIYILDKVGMSNDLLSFLFIN